MRTTVLKALVVGILIAALPFAVFGAGQPESAATKDATVDRKSVV